MQTRRMIFARLCCVLFFQKCRSSNTDEDPLLNQQKEVLNKQVSLGSLQEFLEASGAPPSLIGDLFDKFEVIYVLSEIDVKGNEKEITDFTVKFREIELENLDKHFTEIAVKNASDNYDRVFKFRNRGKLIHLLDAPPIVETFCAFFAENKYKEVVHNNNIDFTDLHVEKVTCDEGLEINVSCVIRNEDLQKFELHLNPYVRYVFSNISKNFCIPIYKIATNDKAYILQPKINNSLLRKSKASSVGEEYYGENPTKGSLKSRTVLKMILEKDEKTGKYNCLEAENDQMYLTLSNLFFIFFMIMAGYFTQKYILS
ncbi:hypothetical protein EDEG_03189 [Edhazardia aedis USNM 41457]|uniref:Protein BIG1 n=1 Tax=Edhazardia aedis (strain USNM 41457) TaxID=1003232 RepID=J9DID5_EDHAE|nr:hypothetical protein EDEG_03189 [Edhazardia aedis USNM 41457]|eukprot:EJW02385.1 hypothetical protein EDEG_03189 [Edhazardia aedis USNM 41457]